MNYHASQILTDLDRDWDGFDLGPSLCGHCDLAELTATEAAAFAASGDAPAPTKITGLRGKPWFWLTASAVLHAMLLFAVARAGVFSLHEPAPAQDVVMELALGGLAGPGGAGGDGRMPGGDGRPAEAGPQPADAPDRAEPPDAPAEPAQEEPREALAPAPEDFAPVPIPEDKPVAAEPEPKPEPKPEPRPEPKPKPAAKAVRPAKAAPPVQTAQAAGPPANGAAGLDRDGGTGGTGPAGPGQGKGPGSGPGPGGTGGDGPGGGGGGEYVGAFGQGNGPTFRHRALPHYPSEAKRGNQEGKVVLRLAIDAEGQLRNAEVVEHTGLDFVEEALRAIRTSTFFPAKRDGRPVPSRAMLAIRFKLE